MLVVVGHVVRGLVSADLMEWTPTARFADTWIYSFHMPLFFFLSGLFLCLSVARLSPWDFLSDRIRAIAYPYFVWSAITVLLKSTLGSIPNTPRGLSDLSLLAFAPIEQYWFLYVLFLLTLLFGALLRSMSPWLVAVVATVIYPGIVPISSGWYVLQEVREFGIYVALGAIVGSNYLSQLLRCNVSVLAIVAIAGLGLPAAYIAIGLPQIAPLLAVSGIAGATALALLLDRVRLAAFVSFLGRHSLEIFVAHTITSAAARTLLGLISVRSPVPHLLVGIAAGIVVPIILSYACKLIGFRMAFTFPKARRQEQVPQQV